MISKRAFDDRGLHAIALFPQQKVEQEEHVQIPVI
jgi:hypothetical protein